MIKSYNFSYLILILLFIACSNNNLKTPKFEKLYEKGMHNYFTYRDSIDLYYDELTLAFNNSKNKNNRAKYLRFQGARFYIKEMPDSAFNHLLEAYNLLNKPSPLKASIVANLIALSSNAHNDSLYRKFYEELETISKTLNDPFINARYNSIKALTIVKKGDVLEGIKYYLKADSIYKSINNDIWRVHVLAALGKNYAIQSEYDRSFQYYLNAIELAKQNHMNHSLSNCYLGLSRLYLKIKQYDNAIQTTKELEKLTISTKHKARVYESYAIIYAEQKMWKEAEKYMLLSLQVKELINNPSAIAVAKNNLGTLYTRKKDYEKAEKYYSEALNLRYNYGLKGTGLLRNLNNLGDLYLNQGKENKAIKLFKEAIKFTTDNPNLRLSSHAHLQLAEIYESQELFKQSIKHYLIFADEEKELNEEKAEQNLAKLMVEYDSENQKRIIVLQKKEMEQKKIAMIWLIIAIVLIIVSTLIVLRWYYFQKKSLEKDIEQQKKINIQQLEIKQLKERIENYASNDQNVLINKLIDLLDNQKIFTDSSLSLDKLARKINTNTSYLSNAINSEFGCNFKTLICKYRIDYCKKIIKENSEFDLPIKQVASEAGFVSISTFYSSFKKETGITPVQYRQLIKAEQEER